MQRTPNDSLDRTSTNYRTGSSEARERRTASPTRPAQRRPETGERRPSAGSSQRRPSQGSSQRRPASSSQGQRRPSTRSAKPAGAQTRSARPADAQTRSARPAGTQRQARPAGAQTRSAAGRPDGAYTRSAAGRPDNARYASRRSDGAGQRPSSRSGYTAKQQKAPKKSHFKRFLIIYSAVLLVILIVGLLIFNSFIGNYEKNQPVNIAKSVAEELSTEPEAYLNDHKDMISSMADTDEVISQYTKLVSGKQVSYVENSDSRADAPSFDLRVDGSNVGKITLEPDGKGSFGLSKWKLSTLSIAEFLPDTYAYTILAPSGYTVSVNGNPLSESYITARDETPEILANASQFIKETPKYDSYTVAGLLSIPTVTAKDASGSEVGVAPAQEYFVAGGEPDKAFIDEQKEFVEDALRSWAYHFINYNQGTNLANYVQSGSDLYAYIFGSDTMDPIYTGFYDWEYITNVEFTEFEVKNFIQYSEDCFSVDVKYRLKVDFSNANLSDDGQMLDATWVFVKNKGYWGIADVIYHQGSESSLADAASGSTSTKEDADSAKKDDDAKADEEKDAAADEKDTTAADEEDTTAADDNEETTEAENETELETN